MMMMRVLCLVTVARLWSIEGDSSNEDASVGAIADAPPTLVDDVDSSDDENSAGDAYEERTTMIGDERVHIPTSILDY